MKIIWAGIISALLIASTPSHSASFNCKKASTDSEKTICSDFRLSLDDMVISKLYSLSMNTERKSIIKNEQKDWLSNRNKCGDNKDCLYSSQIERIKQLDVQLWENSQFVKDAFNSNPQSLSSAIRLIASFIENSSRHQMLPAFEHSLTDMQKIEFSNYGGNLVTGFRLPSSETLGRENSNSEMTLNFNGFATLDSEGMAKCLSSQSISDFKLISNRMMLGSGFANECVDFIWTDTTDIEGNLVPPKMRSSYLKSTISIGDLAADCSYIKRKEKNFCDNEDVQIFMRALQSVNKKTLEIENINKSEIAEENLNWLQNSLSICNEEQCFIDRILARITDVKSLIDNNGTIASTECGFSDNGTYSCPYGDGIETTSVCTTNGKFYQLSESGDDYKLSVWNDEFNWMPDLSSPPSSSTQGYSSTVGTYPCTSTIFEFPEWGLTWGESKCGSGEEPEVIGSSLMTTIYCSEKNDLCSSNRMYCLMVH